MTNEEYFVFDPVEARMAAGAAASGGSPTTRRHGINTSEGLPGFAVPSNEPGISVHPGAADEALAAHQSAGRSVGDILPMALVEPVGQELKECAPPGGEPWGLAAVGAPDSPYTGRGMSVAIIDSGIDADHPGLAHLGSRIRQNDFTGTGLGDPIGHGTHCAGIIAGRTPDGVRIGVATDIDRLLVAKAFGLDAFGNKVSKNQWVAEALLWAIREEADIISMSLGIDLVAHVSNLRSKGWPEQGAFSKAMAGYRRHVASFESIAAYAVSSRKPPLIVAATGNGSNREGGDDAFRIGAEPPAASDGILAVGAVGRTELGGHEVASFSNTGADIVAPGVDVVSLLPGGRYGVSSGTSMATPYAAGVAALWGEWATRHVGNHSATSIVHRMIGQAAVIPDHERTDVGEGLVQAPLD